KIPAMTVCPYNKQRRQKPESPSGFQNRDRETEEQKGEEKRAVHSEARRDGGGDQSSGQTAIEVPCASPHQNSGRGAKARQQQRPQQNDARYSSRFPREIEEQ